MIEFEVVENSSFNSPIEYGLRSLFILTCNMNLRLDLQRLIYLDYLAVHSDDIEGGPSGLHAKIPYRSTEILVKRTLIEKGLMLLVSKELVEVIFDEKGISYQANELGQRLTELFQSEYAANLKSICSWISNKFSSYSANELEDFIYKNLRKWGGEHTYGSIYKNGFLNEDELSHN